MGIMHGMILLICNDISQFREYSKVEVFPNYIDLKFNPGADTKDKECVGNEAALYPKGKRTRIEWLNFKFILYIWFIMKTWISFSIIYLNSLSMSLHECRSQNSLSMSLHECHLKVSVEFIPSRHFIWNAWFFRFVTTFLISVNNRGFYSVSNVLHEYSWQVTFFLHAT